MVLLHTHSEARDNRVVSDIAYADASIFRQRSTEVQTPHLTRKRIVCFGLRLVNYYRFG